MGVVVDTFAGSVRVEFDHEAAFTPLGQLPFFIDFLAEPDRHREAITSRPLLLHAIAERVRHARQTTIKIASTHAKSVPAAKALRAVALFLAKHI